MDVYLLRRAKCYVASASETLKRVQGDRRSVHTDHLPGHSGLDPESHRP